MKYLMIVLAVLFISGCRDDGVGLMGLKRYTDPEFGVACYQVYANSAPLSCVQVQEGIKPKLK